MKCRTEKEVLAESWIFGSSFTCNKEGCSNFDGKDRFRVVKFDIVEDGKLEYIKIGKFLDAVDKKNQENDEDEEDLESSLYDEIQKLKPYRDYELYC
jgi:hypothetical protein